MSNASRWRALAALVALSVAAALIATTPVRLGLDLQGGTQIVLEAKDNDRVKVDADVASRTLEVLRRRVDALGVSEPTLQRSGERRIIIELPGVEDPAEAIEVIGRTAQLEFRPVLGLASGVVPSEPSGSNGASDSGSTPEADVFVGEGGERLTLGPPRVTGEAVGSARAILAGDLSAVWHVAVGFRGDGGREWEQITGEAACAPAGDPRRRVAIVLDRDVISSPQVSPEIACGTGIPAGGDTTITGDFTEREAKDLALLIRAGALPVPVEIVEQRTIGPTLGDAAVRSSAVAAIIGATLTILYMIGYYRLLGVLAALALAVYALLSYAVLVAIGATLTLPGIAGFILAIGMAVDANVLVFERAKDEFADGRSVRSASVAGFRRAWSAIADSNATTLLAAGLLFFYAGGAVRGFGVTLSVGVVVSMFTALVVTRSLVELLMRSPRAANSPGALGLNVGRRLRKLLAERGPDILGRRRLWFAMSAAALALAAGGIAIRGLNYGLDFSGGRLVEYSTSSPADLEAVRDALADRGLPRAVVQRSGEGNVVVRTGKLDGTQEQRVRDAVESTAPGVREVREEFVGPTVGEELRRKARIALGLALAAQMLYLAIRFRWTYAAAAVVAMFHDIILLLGIFAWLGKELDAVFLAALMTVIGYSINDSVVVFDRIREQRRARRGDDLATVANDACLETIPRTVNTGLGALFILAALYFLGGDTLTDFALALIIGILVGTYSSVFTAAPLAVSLERSPSSDPMGQRRAALKPRLSRAEVEADVEDETKVEPRGVLVPQAARSGGGDGRANSVRARPGKKKGGAAKKKRR